MSTPTFSIITCTWNSEPFLADCIASVQRQRSAGFEHVFVDGGSTDGSLQRIQALPGPVVWATDVRGGISNAMNVGADMASQDVIAHLHGDDHYVTDTALATMAHVFSDPSVQWAYGRYCDNVDGELRPHRWTPPPYSRQRLLKGNFIGHPAVFMRRSFFQQLGGFDTRLKYAMDYDLWLRASALAAPVAVDEVLTAFRRHPGSASTANAKAAFREDHQVRRRHLGARPDRRLFHECVYLWRQVRRWPLLQSLGSGGAA